MYKLFFYLVIGSCFIACASNPKSSNSKYSKLKVDVLNEDDLFTHVKVKAYMDGKKESGNEHNKLFLNGLDSYKNKKNLDSAIYYFKQSVLKYPTNTAYYELGNALLENKEYKKAIYAYEIAEKLGYEPFSKVLYNIACAHSLLNQTQLAGQYLEYAIEAGYTNIENINKDKDLKNLRADKAYFETRLKQGLKGMSNAENLFWLQFKRKFNKVPLPLKIDENSDLVLLNDDTKISYDFEVYIAEMRDEKFSREVSKNFYYFAEINETDQYSALVYVISDAFYESDSPLTYRLATFNKNGKLIDKKEIAGRSDFSKPLKMALIKKDLSIVISSYETTFEKDPESEGYYDNKIIDKKKLFDETYIISSNGKIVKKESLDLSLN